MITPAQIKAGRALLNWKQTDLAKASAISLPSINNLERNLISPRANTLQKIQNAMEEAGIQFIDDAGVTKRKELFEILQYDGPDFIAKQNDDLFSCMNGPEDEALMCSLDERMFVKYAPDQITRYSAHHQKTKFREKILVKEGDTFFLAHPKDYRWIPAELIGKVPYLVYKNRFVLIMWEIKRVVIVKNQTLADSFRAQFAYLWQAGKKIPSHYSSKLDDPKFTTTLGKEKKHEQVNR